MFRHVNAGDRTLAHPHARSAVASDDAAEEFKEIGIVTDHQHAFAVGVLVE